MFQISHPALAVRALAKVVEPAFTPTDWILLKESKDFETNMDITNLKTLKRICFFGNILQAENSVNSYSCVGRISPYFHALLRGQLQGYLHLKV